MVDVTLDVADEATDCSEGSSSNGSAREPERVADPRAARTRLLEEIDRAIEPFDTAGLRDRSRRDWYPVLASDLVAGAPKLGATAAEIGLLLARSGFAGEASDTGGPGRRA